MSAASSTNGGADTDGTCGGDGDGGEGGNDADGLNAVEAASALVFSEDHRVQKVVEVARRVTSARRERPGTPCRGGGATAAAAAAAARW